MNRGFHTVRISCCILWGLTWATLAIAPARGENWPRFRGPNGTGISQDKGFPVKWSERDYAWKTPIPGLGHSSPCVWDDHVFLTSAEDDGRTRLVIDVSASTGKIRWVRRMPSETHHINKLNSYASATPASDGQRVYVAFSKESEYCLLAFDFQGNQLWKYVLGPFESQHGSATSPIVFEDMVILGNDQDGPSCVVAVDSKTGELRWKAPRETKKVAYSTPFVLQRHGADPELIFTSWAEGFTSLDARTGRLNWRANIIPQRTVGSPVYGHGMVFGSSGEGGQGKFLAAVRVGGRGELNESYIDWKRERQLPYVPSPILYGEHLYLWGDGGVISCVVAKTGENVWTAERTDELRGKYSGSPVCVDGKLYCVTEDGAVVVIAASPKFQFLGRTPLGEGCHTTPAVSGGRMFIRGFEYLFCLEAKAR
jgi:outer membrane protein assembly factor BamB